jgi:high-affinity nickel-transport protein
MDSISGAVLGVLLGMRHAGEPDHLAAVGTLVAEERSALGGLRLGAFWGLGHTIALFAVAAVLAALQATMPVRVADLFELGVAFMLLALGARAVARAAREGRAGPSTIHAHHGGQHEHRGPSQHVHLGRWTLSWRPLLVGIVHGLAGSGALTALVLAGLPTTSARLLYVAFFGAGSVVGMSLLSGLAGVPLARISRTPAAARILAAASGLVSMAFAVAWGWPLVDRLAR